MKKTEIKKLDKIWSEKIRSKGKCEICGRDFGVLNAHHIINRRNHSVRWDIRNGCCLCFQCHIGNKNSAHQRPKWFEEWTQEHRKEDAEYAEEQRNIVKKQTFEEVWNSLQN